MSRYSLERKNAVINKFHSDNTLSLSELARQESIPTSTLYNWLKQVNLVGNAMSKKRNSDNWSAETKLVTVIETASLSEIELSAYCREKGLYPEQLKQWKSEYLQSFDQSKAQAQALRKELQATRQENKTLQREIRRKEKALAEAAALLMLRKKLNAFWEESEDE